MRAIRSLVPSLGLVLALGSVAGCASDRGGGRDAAKGAAPVVRPAAAAPEAAGAVAPLLHYAVRPSDTDAAIGSPDADHHVYLRAGGPTNGKLLVFLPGTRGRPANATLFLKEAALAGYHAVGLDYPNRESAGEVCGDDLGCYGRMRRAIVEGGRPGAEVDVSRASSIEHRLIALLRWLDRRHPDQGWGSFLTGDGLRYDALAIAGHSQGGGHAAYIGKLHRVARVLLFASVCDTDRSNPPVPATWVTEPHATPIDRYYGFGHTGDVFARKIAVTWPALGLDRLGPGAAVDGEAAPFGGSHQLLTSLSQPTRKRAHGSVVADGATPLRDGVPVYRDVWRYMLGS